MSNPSHDSLAAARVQLIDELAKSAWSCTADSIFSLCQKHGMKATVTRHSGRWTHFQLDGAGVGRLTQGPQGIEEVEFHLAAFPSPHDGADSTASNDSLMESVVQALQDRYGQCDIFQEAHTTYRWWELSNGVCVRLTSGQGNSAVTIAGPWNDTQPVDAVATLSADQCLAIVRFWEEAPAALNVAAGMNAARHFGWVSQSTQPTHRFYSQVLTELYGPDLEQIWTHRDIAPDAQITYSTMGMDEMFVGIGAYTSLRVQARAWSTIQRSIAQVIDTLSDALGAPHYKGEAGTRWRQASWTLSNGYTLTVKEHPDKAEMMLTRPVNWETECPSYVSVSSVDTLVSLCDRWLASPPHSPTDFDDFASAMGWARGPVAPTVQVPADLCAYTQMSVLNEYGARLHTEDGRVRGLVCGLSVPPNDFLPSLKPAALKTHLAQYVEALTDRFGAPQRKKGPEGSTLWLTDNGWAIAVGYAHKQLFVYIYDSAAVSALNALMLHPHEERTAHVPVSDADGIEFDSADAARGMNDRLHGQSSAEPSRAAEHPSDASNDEALASKLEESSSRSASGWVILSVAAVLVLLLTLWWGLL